MLFLANALGAVLAVVVLGVSLKAIQELIHDQLLHGLRNSLDFVIIGLDHTDLPTPLAELVVYFSFVRDGTLALVVVLVVIALLGSNEYYHLRKVGSPSKLAIGTLELGLAIVTQPLCLVGIAGVRVFVFGIVEIETAVDG